jgi:hypothetical protein
MNVDDLREAIKNPPLEWPHQGIRQPKGLRQRKKIYLTFARDSVLAFLTAPLVPGHRQAPLRTLEESDK